MHHTSEKLFYRNLQVNIPYKCLQIVTGIWLYIYDSSVKHKYMSSGINNLVDVRLSTWDYLHDLVDAKKYSSVPDCFTKHVTVVNLDTM